jgi:hypothetical protein
VTTPASIFHQERAAIAAQIHQANERITGLEGQIHDIDQELQGLFAQRQQYQLLNDVCESLDKLESLGAGHLFWGEQPDAQSAKQRVGHARGHATQFLQSIAEIEERRKQLEEGIDSELLIIDGWLAERAELDKEEERKLSEFLVERDISDLPYQKMAMPWDPEGDDAKRYRKIFLLVLLITFSLGSGMAIWKLPPVDKYAPIEVPKRVVKMVQNLPPPPPKKEVKKEEEKKEEKPEEKLAEKPTEKKPTEKATPTEVKAARSKAESTGVLAFKNSFDDLMEDDAPLALGADASIKGSGSAGNQAYAAGGVGNGAPGSRSLIAAQGGAGSGGIANYGISRGGVGSGGGSGGAIAGGGMSVGKRSSGIADMQGQDTKLTAGAGPSRTDEEIQIVFDKYKSALYRIYNRELRNDPTLRGKMVLALTIAPDGTVTACKVQSTDLNSPALSKDIVERVLKFNFGPKEGVPPTKILYPIDFLPAS